MKIRKLIEKYMQAKGLCVKHSSESIVIFKNKRGVAFLKLADKTLTICHYPSGTPLYSANIFMPDSAKIVNMIDQLVSDIN